MTITLKSIYLRPPCYDDLVNTYLNFIFGDNKWYFLILGELDLFPEQRVHLNYFIRNLLVVQIGPSLAAEWAGPVLI